MKVVLQRVKEASVTISGQEHSRIGAGLLLLVGVGPEDSSQDVTYLCRKIVNMRIFSDQEGKMNHSVLDIGGEILSVSQFTLFAQTKKGNRPSYTDAAQPQMAQALYQELNEQLAQSLPVQTGVFGADMEVSLINDGPVTILLDSKNP